MGSGCHVTHDPLDPMGLVIENGKLGDIIVEGVTVSFPVLDVEQNIAIYLCNDAETPITVITGRNFTDPPEVDNPVLLLAYGWIPPRCTDLKTIEIKTMCFDKEIDTPFEGDEPAWEIIK